MAYISPVVCDSESLVECLWSLLVSSCIAWLLGIQNTCFCYILACQLPVAFVPVLENTILITSALLFSQFYRLHLELLSRLLYSLTSPVYITYSFYVTLPYFWVSFSDPTPVTVSFQSWEDKVCAEPARQMHLPRYMVVYWCSVYDLLSAHHTPQRQIILIVSFYTSLALKQTIPQVRVFFCKLTFQ